MKSLCLLPSGFSEKWFQLSRNDLLCLWLTYGEASSFNIHYKLKEKNPVDLTQFITILKASTVVEFHMSNNRGEVRVLHGRNHYKPTS